MNPVIVQQYPGDGGTFQTVELMRHQVESSYLHPWIRERAAVMTSGCRRQNECEHYALLNFVRESVQFIRDPLEAEILIDPVTFIEQRLRAGAPVFGDCAQMTVYLCCLLKAIGHAPNFKVIGDKMAYNHVFVECEGTELDATMPPFETPDRYERMMRVAV